MIGGGYFQFLEISVFFIHRKLRPMNEKALRAGRAPYLAEMKFAVNSTARARKSRKRLFVLHGIMRSGETGWHRVKTPLTGKKFRSGAFFNNKIRAECELYCFDNMVLQQVIREWRLG